MKALGVPVAARTGQIAHDVPSPSPSQEYRRIRIAGAQVVEGVLSMDDARALNVPLFDQRETARLELAGLPARRGRNRPRPLP